MLVIQCLFSVCFFWFSQDWVQWQKNSPNFHWRRKARTIALMVYYHLLSAVATFDPSPFHPTVVWLDPVRPLHDQGPMSETLVVKKKYFVRNDELQALDSSETLLRVLFTQVGLLASLPVFEPPS